MLKFPKEQGDRVLGQPAHLLNGGGMGAPRVSTEPKAADFCRQEQGLREGPRVPGSTWWEFAFLVQCRMTFRSLGRSSSFSPVPISVPLQAPQHSPSPTPLLMANTVTSSFGKPAPPLHDSGHPCNFQTRWSHCVLYLPLYDLPVSEFPHLFGGIITAPK